MGTVLIIILFLSLPTLVICFLAILEEKRKKQIKKALKTKISQLAKENKLKVVEIHLFHNRAIALDKINRKLVFVNHHKEFVDQFFIDLETLVFCKKVKIEDASSKRLEKVFIEVKNKGINEASKLVFYDISFDNMRAKDALIREAEYWGDKINFNRKTMRLSYAFEYVL